MKKITTLAFYLLAGPLLADTDTPPDEWLRASNCQQVLDTMANPSQGRGFSEAWNGIARTGAVFGYIEGFRVAIAVQPGEIQPPPANFRETVLQVCRTRPEMSFTEALLVAAVL